MFVDCEVETERFHLFSPQNYKKKMNYANISRIFLHFRFRQPRFGRDMVCRKVRRGRVQRGSRFFPHPLGKGRIRSAESPMNHLRITYESPKNHLRLYRWSFDKISREVRQALCNHPTITQESPKNHPSFSARNLERETGDSRGRSGRGVDFGEWVGIFCVLFAYLKKKQ